MISFWSRLFDFIAPRACVICGSRLAISEDVICTSCNLHIPRTDYHFDAYDNPMARLFWGRIPVERATALFFYLAHSGTSNILYQLKYHHHPEIGEKMGRMLASEIKSSGFFDDIDAIVPIPLAKKRLRQRGYNQSMELAKGINQLTGIPIHSEAVVRKSFVTSQTRLHRWERNDNVENVFSVTDVTVSLTGQHILLIDDVVTTGATITACAKEMLKAGGMKFSILSLGLAKS